MSVIWYSFKVASLFFGGSTDYLQEGWVIPRQVGADFSSPLLKAAGERGVTKPGSPDKPSRRSGQGMQTFRGYFL